MGPHAQSPLTYFPGSENFTRGEEPLEGGGWNDKEEEEGGGGEEEGRGERLTVADVRVVCKRRLRRCPSTAERAASALSLSPGIATGARKDGVEREVGAEKMMRHRLPMVNHGKYEWVNEPRHLHLRCPSSAHTNVVIPMHNL